MSQTWAGRRAGDIVGCDPFTSILKNHWDFFVSELPGAESVFVTREFLA